MYNKLQGKWKSEKYLDFLRLYRLDETKVINTLNHFYINYFEGNEIKGKIGFEKFLTQLNKKIIDDKTIIDLKTGIDKNEFLMELKNLKMKYMDIDTEKYIRFIHSNFKTNLEHSTLRRYYFDKT